MSPAPSQRRTLRTAALASLLLVSGCGPSGTGAPVPGEPADPPLARVVDSIFSIEEELRRFREGTSAVTELGHAAGSKQALIDRMMASLERADSVAVASLAMNREEFAWLYYPNSMYTAPPYALPPGLVWYQQQNRSSRGLTRLLRRYAGRELFYTGYHCAEEPRPFGDGSIWDGCRVVGELPSGERVEERLFGSILELRGQFKFVSFSNEL